MAAHENLSPGQFPTLPAHEIVARWRAHDRDRLGGETTATSDSVIWARKAAATREGHRAEMVLRDPDDTLRTVTMHEHVGTRGVLKPVALQHPDFAPEGERPAVFDGHHRVAAAYDNDPDMPVPYTYVQSVEQMREERRRSSRR